ncbi:MAG TPA: PaaI family thioesterase [Candidatus Acidoferrales bacterium]|nr:PaaI family thioesterase [Candidatus Acidoferrales bacterium]
MSDDAALDRPPSGYERTLGLRVTALEDDQIRGQVEVGPEHLQPAGIVHGGVYCGMVETLASIGAERVARARGQHVVGIENSTSFLRAVSAGHLFGVAVPVTTGRTTQLWHVRIHDDRDRSIASGKVRLMCLANDPGLPASD